MDDDNASYYVSGSIVHPAYKCITVGYINYDTFFLSKPINIDLVSKISTIESLKHYDGTDHNLNARFKKYFIKNERKIAHTTKKNLSEIFDWNKWHTFLAALVNRKYVSFNRL